MKYKVVITDSEDTINNWLDQGWRIQSVTAQHIGGGGELNYMKKAPFCFVIAKTEEKNIYPR